MASVYEFKSAFQKRLRPLTRFLAAVGVSANQVTLAALLLSVIEGVAIALFPEERWPLLLLPLVLFVRLALNAIDGMLAREHGMKTRLGAVLNELGDVLSDAALYLPLALVPDVEALWIVGLVLLCVIAEMTGVIAVQIDASRRYDGPMGKSDRALTLGAISLLLGLGAEPGAWLTEGLVAINLLLIVTIINRARRALQEMAL